VCLALYRDRLFCFCCAVCCVSSGTKISYNFVMCKLKNSISPSLFSHDEFCKGVFLLCVFLSHLPNNEMNILWQIYFYLSILSSEQINSLDTCNAGNLVSAVQSSFCAFSATAVFLQVHVNSPRHSLQLPVKNQDNCEGM
jgi:hypothetical protein